MISASDKITLESDCLHSDSNPVAIVKRIIPTKAKAIPIEQINTYFQAASIECFVL